MGQWVLDVRLYAGFASQDDFADRLGVNRTTVADWERGANLPEGMHILTMIKMHSTLLLPGQSLPKSDITKGASVTDISGPNRTQPRPYVRDGSNRLRNQLKSSQPGIESAFQDANTESAKDSKDAKKEAVSISSRDKKPSKKRNA